MRTLYFFRPSFLVAATMSLAACTGSGFEAARGEIAKLPEASAVAVSPPVDPSLPLRAEVVPAPPVPAPAVAPSTSPSAVPAPPVPAPAVAPLPSPPPAKVPASGAAAPPHMHYGCPMDAEIRQATPGRCPICEMRLVLMKDEPAAGSADDAKP